VESSAPDKDVMETKKHFGRNAQLLTSPQTEQDRKLYFADLPGELQRVLRVQLGQPGDVSAAIEMPDGFALYLAIDKTTNSITVGVLSVPKRSYKQWLKKQDERNP
jgi:hypothetical protein